MNGVADYLRSLGTFGAEPHWPRNQVYPTFAIIDALKATMGKVYLAAERLGCDPQTIYNRAKQEPAIELAMRMARGKTVDKAELKLEVALDNGEAWAIQMVLKTLGKDRGYVERQEFAGPAGGAIPVRLIEFAGPAGSDDGSGNPAS